MHCNLMTDISPLFDRPRWISAFARATPAELEAWFAPRGLPSFRWLRQPEVGLVMVRGRAGGTGAQFNLGEATVTRCVLRVDPDAIGIGYVKGRDTRHAQLAAIADALMQLPGERTGIARELLPALERARAAREEGERRRAAATRVEFFTLARESA